VIRDGRKDEDRPVGSGTVLNRMVAGHTPYDAGDYRQAPACRQALRYPGPLRAQIWSNGYEKNPLA
jgi:hypothetical protein